MSTERSLASARTGMAPADGAAAIPGTGVLRSPATPAARAAAARLRMASQALILERRAVLASGRERLLRALALASGLFCALFLILLFVVPLRKEIAVRTVVLLPPPRTVVLEESLPEPPPVADQATPPLEQLNVTKVPDPPALEAPQAETPPEPVALPPPRRRTNEAPADPVAAQAGRDRARDATAGLASATAALDQALGALSSSLRAPNTGTDETTRRAPRRAVRSGRSTGELGAVGNDLAGSGAADLGATVQGSKIEIGALSPPRPDEGAPVAEASKTSAAGPGVYRTNASLLAVIQKYAAGIQYCYENELKRQAGLKGKLVVALTVAASGSVLDATVVRNTVGSERLAACALSQIREWRFPPVPEGVTTFQAPFVFTPPN